MWFQGESAVVDELAAVEAGKWVVEKRSAGAVVDSQQIGGKVWLRVSATFRLDEYDELIDVLDTNLQTRQKEWHALLLDGGGCVKQIDESRSIFYFAYSSPWPLSARSVLYCKLKIPILDGVKLVYWTISDDSLKPEDDTTVRIDFKAMHVLTKTEDGVSYVYLQQSDPKIKLPAFLLKHSQMQILFGEIEGLRKAVMTK
jgi:hypothetical protein